MTCPNCTEAAKRTGWPPGLLQDDDRKLSRWFAGRPGARRQIDARLPTADEQQEIFMDIARRRYVESFISGGEAA